MVSHVAVSVAQQPTRARRRITCNCRASLFSQPRLRLVPCPYRLQTTGITLTFWKSGLERGTEEVEGKKCPNTKPRIGFIHLATCILQLWEPAAKIMCRDHIRYRRRKRGGKKASTQLENKETYRFVSIILVGIAFERAFGWHAWTWWTWWTWWTGWTLGHCNCYSCKEEKSRGLHFSLFLVSLRNFVDDQSLDQSSHKLSSARTRHSAMAAIKEPPLVLGVLSGISYVSGIDYYKVCWRTLICAAITPICELSHHHYSS